ncbi:MAG: glycosyltransferase family 2 protein [Phocaeicola sp.]
MITIAIPLYNAEKYISQSVRSVLDQTFQNLELIIVNDCSTDNSVDIVQTIIDSNPTTIPIRLIHLEKNQGVAIARNRAIKEAKGDYIFFLDSDDQITTDCISTLYGYAKNYSCQLIIGSYAYGREGELPMMHEAVHEYAIIENNFEFFKYKYSYTRNSLFTMYIWNILFKVDFLRSNKFLFNDLRKGEDHLFFLTIIPFISSCVILPNVTYHYILRDNSLSNYNIRTKIPSNEIETSVDCLRFELSIVKGWNDNIFYPEIIYQQIRDAIWMLLSIMKKEKIITPFLPIESMHFLSSHPLKFNEICMMRRKKLFHVSYYFFGILPISIKLSLIRLFITIKK